MTTFFRTLLGTIVYTIIIVLAAPFPSAAGLFLTFPALNGLGFFFSPQSSIESMAKSMLWMPVINGALCAGYIVAFLALAQIAAPSTLAWGFIFAATALWFAIVSRKIVKDGIAAKHQLAYGIIVLIAGCALAMLASRVLSALAIAQGSGSSSQVVISVDFLLRTLWQSKLKISLFAACLLLFLVLTEHLPISPGVRGILAGLPIVPFGGLVSVAGDTGVDLSARMHVFERMTASVWLGPAVAVCFIYAYSKYLTTREPIGTTALDSAMKLAVLATAWLACGVAILGIAYALSNVGGTERETPQFARLLDLRHFNTADLRQSRGPMASTS